MREVWLSDLDLAARAVMAVRPDQQEQFASQLIEEAHVCDLWRKRFGVPHSSGGTGSLYAQASLYRSAPSGLSDSAYCRAFCFVLQALEVWRRRTHKVV